MQEEDGGGSQRPRKIHQLRKAETFKLYDEQTALLDPNRLPDYDSANSTVHKLFLDFFFVVQKTTRFF